MPSSLKSKLSQVGVVVLVVATGIVGMAIIPASAQEAVGGPMASASRGVIDHIKRALRIGQTANRRSVRAIRIARAAREQGGQAGPEGPVGPRGPAGPRGPEGPSTGPAGGDLSGDYPDPAIGAGAVSTENLSDNAVTATKLGSIQRRTASVTLATGQTDSVTANCGPGELLISGAGGFEASSVDPHPFLIRTRKVLQGWEVRGHNPGNGNQTLTAYAYCLVAP